MLLIVQFIYMICRQGPHRCRHRYRSLVGDQALLEQLRVGFDGEEGGQVGVAEDLPRDAVLQVQLHGLLGLQQALLDALAALDRVSWRRLTLHHGELT